MRTKPYILAKARCFKSLCRTTSPATSATVANTGAKLAQPGLFSQYCAFYQTKREKQGMGVPQIRLGDSIRQHRFENDTRLSVTRKMNTKARAPREVVLSARIASEVQRKSQSGNRQLKERLDEISGTIACHSSVRAGRRLNGDEMNAMLREMEMERVPHSGQCNHVRPICIEMKLKDIERLFGRA